MPMQRTSQRAVPAMSVQRTGIVLHWQGENELAKAASILCSLIMPATERPLFVPVILGTPRQGRRSEHPAHLVLEETKKRAGVETELIDVRALHMRLDDAGEEMKDPAFSAKVERADALILVVPEYNHGYPGLLKHALDMNLKEYVHKAVGICGVSAGPFGGTRVIEPLLPVLRGLGLVTIFEDANFGKIGTLFHEPGNLVDQNFV